jgi:hypothetical protein
LRKPAGSTRLTRPRIGGPPQPSILTEAPAAIWTASVEGDAKQSVVGRTAEPPGIEHELIVEIQNRRLSRTFVLKHVLGALGQRIEEDNPAFPDIALIGQEIRCELEAARFMALLFRRVS